MVKVKYFAYFCGAKEEENKINEFKKKLKIFNNETLLVANLDIKFEKNF